MSTTTISSPQRSARGSLTFAGVLRSEWIKFRSLRSTQLLLAFTFLAVVGVGTMAAWVQAMSLEQAMANGMNMGMPGAPVEPMTLSQAQAAMGFNIYAIPNAGLQIGILILGALAVLLISSEFGTGMIRSTMTAVPKRLPAFFAKAVVLIVVSYVLTLLAAIATTVIAIPIFSSYGIDISFGLDGVAYSILMGGLYVAGVALIGLSLGTLLRSSAGGIIVLVVIFFLLDFGTQLMSLMPGEFWKYVNQYVPSVAGGRMLEITEKAAFISPLSGGLIFVGWILLFMIPAIISLKNRDV
ncbi:ABC transporter permease [Arthrobacter psychrolactophilus]|uniref:ABC transporter permease n=1 Tax=Arthrobacter psychrolactophilus TaxID=92442 RepID=A0A2V5JIG5_9MICC|nr:ABC transporter permease [Arthrobacter psychrolactophilus]PYI39987.1 ABC transporter permease [Arthrobacter psychrolactophilus]